MAKVPEGSSLDSFMDWLTHDVEAEEWREEVADMVLWTPDGICDMALLVFDPNLEDPQLSKWNHAFVWHLAAKYEDDAVVVLREDLQVKGR